jgi:hypothetical protein
MACPEFPNNMSEFKKLTGRLATRVEKFPVAPGLKALGLWALCTTIYVLCFVYIEKHKFADDTISNADRNISIASGFLGYFVFVLPLCLGVYIFGLYNFAKDNYKEYYPDSVWPGSIFWGGICMLILGGIITCVILIQHYQGNPLSVTWILPLAFMAVIISVGAGSLSQITINCKLTASDEYKQKFNCADIQSRKIVGNALKADADKVKKFSENLEEATRGQKEFSKAITPESISRIASQQEIIDKSRGITSSPTSSSSLLTSSSSLPTSSSSSSFSDDALSSIFKIQHTR